MVLEALVGWTIFAQDQTVLVERAGVFHRLALRGGRTDGPVIPPFEPIEAVPKVFQEDGKTIVHFGGTMVRLDSRTGCVDFYSGSAGYTLDYVKERGRHRPAVLSDSEVARLARTYMGAADPRLEGVLLRSVEVQDDPLGTVVVSASPTYRGVPFGGNTLAIFELDPLTGRLNTFMHGPRIAPPDSVVPQIGLEAARDVALEELARFHGATQVREIERLELCIVRPVAETRGQEEWFTPSQLALGAAYRGILAYAATYGRLDSLMEDGAPFHQYRTLVDAQTGRVLALWHLRPLLGGGGSAKPAPFAWNLGPAPILLTTGAWSKTVDGSVDLVPPPPSFKADRKVGLTVGRLSVHAEYDAKQGLLRTKVGKGYRYGKPSADLVNVLRETEGL